MIADTANRYSSHRAACKQWSAALAVIILLVGGIARLHPVKMIWATGPLILIGLVEAGFAGQEGRCAELLRAKKGNEETALLLPEAPGTSAVRTTLAVLSPSIWAFYLILFVVIAVGGEQMASIDKKSALAATALNAPSGQKPMRSYFPTTASSMQVPGGYPPMFSPQTMPPQSFPPYRQFPGNSASTRSSAGAGKSGIVRTIPSALPPKVPATLAKPDSANRLPSVLPQPTTPPIPVRGDNVTPPSTAK